MSIFYKVIAFLGGLNEIGKNITLFECQNDIVILDCGMAFPDIDMLGVDLVIPEENWQQKRSDVHEYHIDTFVMGDDWKGKFDFLREEGVEVVYLPRTPEVSTSRIKKDIYDANAVDGESKTSHDDIDTNPGK